MNKQQKKWAERLQALMAERKYRPMKQHELLDALQLKSSARTAFRSVMHTLDDEGAIERTKNNRWALPAVSREVEGSLTVTPAGFGFVAVTKQDPENPSEDVFIPRQDMGSARHGDIVIVRVSDREKRPEENQGADGRIVKVLKRGKDELTGILMERRGHWSLIPDDPRISGRIKI
jgi:ribonuclease R